MTRGRLPRRWMVVGLIVIAIAFVPTPMTMAAPTDRHFRIEASRFQYTPAALTVNPGDHVTIDLVATDVVHGLYIDGYDLNVVADPGRTASLSFVADQVGTFRFRCSVTCGALHPFMIGKLNVGNNDLLWRGLALAILAAVASVWLARPGDKRQ
jgi:heme/copper-type cytochrome/quinol oxidase subunit 2